MTDLIPVAIISGLPATIAAIGAFIVSMRNSKKADDTKAVADSIDTKADQIHTLVNSNMTEVKQKLADALDRVNKLESLIAVIAKQPLKEIKK